MKVTRNSTIAATFLGLLAAASLPAMAGNVTEVTEVTATAIVEPTSVVVSYADLDLSSPEGVEALHYRIANAAREACGSADLRRVGSLQIANRNQSCYEASVSDALASIPSTQVAASR
jgi:UrcA family protein